MSSRGSLQPNSRVRLATQLRQALSVVYAVDALAGHGRREITPSWTNLTLLRQEYDVTDSIKKNMTEALSPARPEDLNLIKEVVDVFRDGLDQTGYVIGDRIRESQRLP